jgi:hypothetical protein
VFYCDDTQTSSGLTLEEAFNERRDSSL